jgi:hypothetical protein
MFRHPLVLWMAISFLITGCRQHEPQQAGLFRQPNWWERRMDRLDTWNRHHGYALDKAKEGTVATIAYTLLGVAAVAGIVCWATAEAEKPDPNEPVLRFP